MAGRAVFRAVEADRPEHAVAAHRVDAGDVVIRCNSRALLTQLLQSKGIAPEHHAATFLALDKRGKLSEEDIRAQLVEDGLREQDIGKVLAELPPVVEALSGLDLQDLIKRLPELAKRDKSANGGEPPAGTPTRRAGFAAPTPPRHPC